MHHLLILLVNSTEINFYIYEGDFPNVHFSNPHKKLQLQKKSLTRYSLADNSVLLHGLITQVETTVGLMNGPVNATSRLPIKRLKEVNKG